MDAAIVDGTAHLSAILHGFVSLGLWRDRRGTNLLDTGAPFYDVYETADGEHMAVGAIEPQFFAELVALLGIADRAPDQNDRERWPELRALIAEVFRTRTREEWTGVFAGSDACVAPVLAAKEAAAHPHLAARGTLVERDGLTQPAPAPRFSRTAAELGLPPCAAGAHTREALADWGFEDVDALVGAGTVVQG